MILRAAMMAAVNPLNPGIPNSPAGANPINRATAEAPPLTRGVDFSGRVAMTAKRSAKLAVYAQIMINAGGTLAGTGKGSFAADKAIRALYLISRYSTRLNTSSRVAGNALRIPVLSMAVAATDRIIATLEGQNCAASQ